MARVVLVVAALAATTVAAWAVDPGEVALPSPYNYSTEYLEAGKAVAFDGKYWFVVRGDKSCYELWISDGTSGGTKQVLGDIGATSSGSTSIAMCGVMNAGGRGKNLLFFTANPISANWGPGKHADWYNIGWELYATDGASLIDGFADDTHTFLVKNIWNTEPTTVNSSFPKSMATMGGKLYFSATTGNTAPGTGRELYASDGSSTAIVQDINAGTGDALDTSNNPAQLSVTTKADGTRTIFFVADNGLLGPELWRSNGLAATPAATLTTGKVTEGAGAYSATWTACDPYTGGTDTGIAVTTANETGAGHAGAPANDDYLKLAVGYRWQGSGSGWAYLDIGKLLTGSDTGTVDLSGRYELRFFYKCVGAAPSNLGIGFTTTNITPVTAWNGSLLLRQPVAATTTWQEKRIPLSSYGTVSSTVQAVKYLAFAQQSDNIVVCDICIDDVTVYDYGAGNTAPLRDLGAIATNTAAVKSLTAINDKAYFYYAGVTYQNGVALAATANEPFVSDGTYAGTVLLDKVTSANGSTASNPGSFVLGPGGNEVYFSATTEGYGNELFRINAGAQPASVADACWVGREPCERWTTVLKTGCTATFPAPPTAGSGGTPPADSVKFTMASSTYGASDTLLFNAIPALDCSAGGTLWCKVLSNSTYFFFKPALNTVQTGASAGSLALIGNLTVAANVWTDAYVTVPANTYSRIIGIGIQNTNHSIYTETIEVGGFRWVPNSGTTVDFPIGGSGLGYPWTVVAASGVTVARDSTAMEGRAAVAIATTSSQAADTVLAESTQPTYAASWSGATRLSCWAQYTPGTGNTTDPGNGAFRLRLWNGTLSQDVALNTTLLGGSDTWLSGTWVFCEADIASAVAALGGAVTKIQVVQWAAGSALGKGRYTLRLDAIRTKNFDGARVCDMAVKGASGSSPALATAAGGLVAFRANGGTTYVATNGVNKGQEVYGFVPESNTYLLLKDVRSSSTSTSGTDLLTAVGGAVCYIASTASTNGYREVYRSYKIANGSYAARLTKDLNTTNTAAGPVSLTAVGSTLFYGHSTNQANPNRLYAFDAAADTLTVSAVTQVDSDAGSRYAKSGSGPFSFVLTVAGTGLKPTGTPTYTAKLYRAGAGTLAATATGVTAAVNTSAAITFTGITNANLPVGAYNLEVTVAYAGNPAEYTLAPGVFAVTGTTPVISSLTPSAGLTSEAAKSLTIAGTAFGGTAGTATLVAHDNPATTVSLTGLGWTDTGITGSVNLTGRAGIWDLRVTTADGGVAALGSALTVTDASITSALLTMNPATWPVTQGAALTLSAWGQGPGTGQISSCDSGWTAGFAGVTVLHDGGVVREGTKAVRAQLTGAASADAVLASVDVGSGVTLTAATRVSFWVRLVLPGVVNTNSKLAANSLRLELYDNTSALVKAIPVDVDLYDRIWARVTGEFAAFGGTVQTVKLVAGATITAGTYVWIDDICWTDGASLTYKFRVRTYSSATGTYSTVTLRDFAAAPTYAWTPSVTGPYWITTEVKLGASAAAASPEVYTRIDPATLTAVALAKTGASAPYTLTATKTGTATNVEYKFVVNLRTTAAGVVPARYTAYVVRDYASGATCAWNPATTGGSASGTLYQLFVYARIAGSTSSLQVYSPKLQVAF
jgi:ELWxxDGT repeat protein